jgi:hypothetical protein
VHERVDSAGASVPEELDLLARELVGAQDPEANGIVDVVVDVRHAIDEPHDPSLERHRLDWTGVGEDALADFGGEVQLLGDAVRLLVVSKAGAEAFAQAAVELVLAGVPERRVADVVAQPDRFGQILVQPQRSGDDSGDAARLESVRHAGAVVISCGVDEDLCLAFEPAERLRVENAVAVALERRPQLALVLVACPPACRVGVDGER